MIPYFHATFFNGLGNYPTWGWSPGEYVVDRWPIQLPDDLPPGDDEVQIGFYRQAAGERMPVRVDGVDARLFDQREMKLI